MIPTFSKSGHGNQKKFMISGKVRKSAKKMVHAEGTFLWWGLSISSFKTIAYIIGRQRGTCRICLLLQRLCMPSVKITTYVCNRFNTSSCTKDHKSHNLNLHTYLAPCICDFIDNSVLKKGEGKVHIKIFLNRFMLIWIKITMNKNCNCIIYQTDWYIDIFYITWNRHRLLHWYLFTLDLHYSFTFILHLHFYIYIPFHLIRQPYSVLQNHSYMWCLVTFNKIFFLTPLKDDYPWREPNPRCSKLFALK